MKVQTDVKSGAFLDAAASQVGAATKQVTNFFSQANSQANAVSSFVTNKSKAVWNALFS